MKPTIPSQFKGMAPIMVTTIHPSGEIDEESQRNIIRYCLECGSVAIGHLAFASEFYKLTVSQRRQVITILVDEVGGRIPTFIGVAGASNKMAVEFAKEAQGLGADMVMASIPYVVVPGSDDVCRYYNEICRAVSIPVILQDTTASAAILTAELILRLADENSNLRHVKPEGKGYLAKVAKLKALAGDRLDIMGGYGGRHMIHMLRQGVTSFMTGTEALDLHAAVVNAFLAGERESAAQLYYNKLLPYLLFLDEYFEELPKRLLHFRGLISHPGVLKPGPSSPQISEVEWNELLWVLERISFNTWPFRGLVKKLA